MHLNIPYTGNRLSKVRRRSRTETDITGPARRGWTALRNRFGGSLNVDPTDPSDVIETIRLPMLRRSSTIDNASLTDAHRETSPTCIIPQLPNQHRQSLVDSSTVPTLEPPSRITVPSIDTSVLETKSIRSGSCTCLQPNTSPTSMGPGIPTPMRRASASRPHDRRKSLLSEVWTPDDFPEPKRHRCSSGCDKNGSYVPGGALASPTEDIEQDYFRGSGINQIAASGHDGTMSRRRSTSMDDDEIETEQPLFHRMSWGTQIFTPNPDGIEVDGLPVGPGQEIWSSGERSYL